MDQDKRITIIGSVVILIMGILAAVYLLWYRSYTEIDLTQQTAVVFSGYDSMGMAQVVKEPDTGSPEFWDSVTASLDRDSGLSNGEEIMLTFTYDESLAKENKIRVTADKAQVRVTGLEPMREITCNELFGSLNLVYSGMSPEVTVDLVNLSEDDFIKNVAFYIEDEQPCYASGDIVRVTAAVDEAAALELGIRLYPGTDGYTLSYTIPEGDSYLTAGSQLSSDDLKKLADQGLKYFTDQTAKEYGLRIYTAAGTMYYFVNSDTTFTWQNPRALSAYFHTAKKDALLKADNYVNYLQICYEATLYQRCDGAAVQAEIIVQFDDLTKDADGNVNLNLESGRIVSASFKDSDIKKVINSGEDEYDTEKLSL